MNVLGLGWGGGEVKVSAGDVSISRGIGRRVIGVGGGDKSWRKRGKRDGKTTDNISTKKRDGILGGNFLDGTIWFLGVALVRMGLLESLSKIIVLIGGGRIEMERDGVLSREIGVDKRVESGLETEFSGEMEFMELIINLKNEIGVERRDVKEESNGFDRVIDDFLI